MTIECTNCGKEFEFRQPVAHASRYGSHRVEFEVGTGVNCFFDARENGMVPVCPHCDYVDTDKRTGYEQKT